MKIYTTLCAIIFYSLSFKLKRVNSQMCGNLVEGQLYNFVNSEFDCVVDIVHNNLKGVPGTISISFKKGYSCADLSCTNQMHYIKKVGWSNDTFLIVEAYDNLVLDTCSGVLTRENPTCGSSQLFKSIPAPDGNCYIVAQSMCSSDVIAAPGNDATCQKYAGIPVQSQGGSATTWSFTTTSKSGWMPTYPACSSTTSPPTTCPYSCVPTTTGKSMHIFFSICLLLF